MSRIYEEALLDAKKIRDAAEQAAKDRIMETITPQIRQMINNRILFEQEQMEELEPELPFDLVRDDDDMDFESIVDKMPDTDIEDDVMDAAADAAVSVFAAGDVNIEIDQEDDDDDEVDLMTDTSLAEAFAKIIRSDFLPDERLAQRIEKLSETTKKLKDVLGVITESKLSGKQQERLELSFISLIKEAVSLQSDLRHSGRGSQRLESKLNSTIKEMREMSSMYKKNIFDFLFEAEEDKSKREGMHGMMEQDDAEAVEADVEDAPADEADVDVDAASDALEDLGDALGLDLEIAEEEAEEEEADEEDEGEELDLEENDLEEMYEVNEAALRKELRRMRRRRLREQEEAVDTYADTPAEEIGHIYVDVDEDDLINALADELGTVDAGDEVTPEELAESRRRRSSRKSTTLRKALKEAAEYKRAAKGLKKQLVEMNLFNAKLLYANKLLQNKNLTVKQQRAIVEALDNAKTLREAKLLYKSLSGSLARRGQGGKTLSESVRRTLGSSSRSTRSAQPSKNGVETDRWAVLAGIGK